MIPILLLKNSFFGVDKNACFTNCIINVLRRVKTFKDILPALSNETLIHSNLQNLFFWNTQIKVSASQLRREIDNLKGDIQRTFSSGNQQDCKEFLDALLEFMPSLSDLFKFTFKRTYLFVGHRFFTCMFLLSHCGRSCLLNWNDIAYQLITGTIFSTAKSGWQLL